MLTCTSRVRRLRLPTASWRRLCVCADIPLPPRRGGTESSAPGEGYGLCCCTVMGSLERQLTDLYGRGPVPNATWMCSWMKSIAAPKGKILANWFSHGGGR